MLETNSDTACPLKETWPLPGLDTMITPEELMPVGIVTSRGYSNIIIVVVVSRLCFHIYVDGW